MKRILIKSVDEAFEYVMDHYYPYGYQDQARRKDEYVVISIQDSHCDGFGLTFQKSEKCKEVLTLYFDDIIKDVEGCHLFDQTQAKAIIDFVQKNIKTETLLIHCYAGQSRSRAVGTFIYEILGEDPIKYIGTNAINEVVYQTLKKTYLSLASK